MERAKDLWVEILSYLPVKHLLRLRTVSKSWKSIIEDPKFASVHSKRCANNIQNPYLIFSEKPEHSQTRWVLRHSAMFRDSPEVSEVNFPADRTKTWKICGGVGGLILLRIEEYQWKLNENIVLWNPSIRKAIPLPPNPSLPGPDPVKKLVLHVHLVFDASSDDYKVLMIHYHEYKDTIYVPSVDIFSLKSRSWRKLVDNGGTLGKIALFDESGCCIGESAHWIGVDLSESSDSIRVCQLISFHLTSNMFSYTQIPDTIHGALEKKVIGLAGSTIGLLANFDVCCIKIWALERSSSRWTSKCHICVDFEGPQTETFCLQAQKRDVLLLGFKTLYSYDLETDEFKLVLMDYLRRTTYVGPYIESLLLL